MNQRQEQIAHFRKMANDDPDNELGHFRLGQLLQEDGQLEEAIQSFRRTLDLSPQFSKVYQLLGVSLKQLARRDEAIQVLRDGFAIADERGDNIPRDAMSQLLVDMGETPPQPKKTTSARIGPGDGFHCRRPGCMAGSHAHQLPKPPMNDDIGKRIHATVCAQCWEYWLRDLSIKVINEMRLDLSTEQDAEKYDHLMRETLGLES